MKVLTDQHINILNKLLAVIREETLLTQIIDQAEPFAKYIYNGYEFSAAPVISAFDGSCRTKLTIATDRSLLDAQKLQTPETIIAGDYVPSVTLSACETADKAQSDWVQLVVAEQFANAKTVVQFLNSESMLNATIYYPQPNKTSRINFVACGPEAKNIVIKEKVVDHSGLVEEFKYNIDISKPAYRYLADELRNYFSAIKNLNPSNAIENN